MMYSPEERQVFIGKIRALPTQLRATVQGLDDTQLDFSPAAGEWSVRQIVHHLADAHMNGVTRMKWALTEDHPTIKPYLQESWAELPDTRTAPIELSLSLLDVLHTRWVFLLENLSEESWNCIAIHPERGELTLDMLLWVYAGHGENHLNQIATVKAAQGL
jgi:hypothetical protein